ncbi:MAG: EAL domain-containing protein [Burkholderiaceae bacterium]|nr:EAL domain-containing protein [Burkholderiaceae bacterium]
MRETWFLEDLAADSTRLTHRILTWPCRIGRDPAGDLVIDAHTVSRRHAELALDADGKLWLTDLGSSNGTRVNGETIQGRVPVAAGDVVHFGQIDFRLGVDSTTRLVATAADDDRTQIVSAGQALAERFVRKEPELLELMRGQGLSAAAQPIVDAQGGTVWAYELLGRCTHPGLPSSPMQLFVLAAKLKRAAELSEAFRAYGVRALAPRLSGQKVFVNTHPSETFAGDFFAALKALKDVDGAPELVVEVHETAAENVAAMRELAAGLADIDVPFAYDDFGAGQSRLQELVKVPPHFVKFDMGLIRGLDQAPAATQDMVRGLVRGVIGLGSVPLAEGVETEGEAAICRDMGFQLIQGYLTGRPRPVGEI